MEPSEFEVATDGIRSHAGGAFKLRWMEREASVLERAFTKGVRSRLPLYRPGPAASDCSARPFLGCCGVSDTRDCCMSEASPPSGDMVMHW